jgi:hypothetical protein
MASIALRVTTLVVKNRPVLLYKEQLKLGNVQSR